MVKAPTLSVVHFNAIGSPVKSLHLYKLPSMNSIRRTLCLFLVIISFSGFSQKGYDIQLRISGLKDTTAYLGYFINESTFIKIRPW